MEEKKKPRVSYEVTKRYQDKSMKAYRLVFHKVNDGDVIAQLDSVENKTDYIRQLIRKSLS